MSRFGHHGLLLGMGSDPPDNPGRPEKVDDRRIAGVAIDEFTLRLIPVLLLALRVVAEPSGLM